MIFQPPRLSGTRATPPGQEGNLGVIFNRLLDY